MCGYLYLLTLCLFVYHVTAEVPKLRNILTNNHHLYQTEKRNEEGHEDGHEMSHEQGHELENEVCIYFPFATVNYCCFRSNSLENVVSFKSFLVSLKEEPFEQKSTFRSCKYMYTFETGANKQIMLVSYTHESKITKQTNK